MMYKTSALTLPIFGALRLKINFKIFWIFLAAIIFSLLLVSVYQLNRQTQEVYLIQDLQNKIGQLYQENKALEISLSSANSLKNINAYIQNQSFVKVGKVEYIYLLGETALAK